MAASNYDDLDIPVLVEVLRGEIVESRHRGSFAIVDAKGGVVAHAGAIDLPVYPRSAVKPLQALPLIETGTADALALNDEALALACASHNGEPMHVEKVTAFLARAGLAESDLECGAQRPSDNKANEALIRTGTAPGALHNNCSGKHAGFLATARHLAEPTAGYIERDHPAQIRVALAMGEMMGLDLSRGAWAVDGCGIPSFAVPLRSLALAMARLADQKGLADSRRNSASRLLKAMAAHPLLVEGTGTMTSEIMRLAGTQVLLKPGAEGVFCAALPTRGLGLALKIEDGHRRGGQLATMVLLDRLGCFDAGARESLRKFLAPPVRNVVGRVVGSIRPSTTLAATPIQHLV